MKYQAVRALIQNQTCLFSLAVRRFFEKEGFSLTTRAGDLVGKIIAIDKGTFRCDFVSYPVQRLVQESEGFCVRPRSNTVSFGKVNSFGSLDAEGNYTESFRPTSRQVSEIELFLPKYLLRQGVFVCDDLPESIKTDDWIGWFPPKCYVTEEDIKKHEPKMYAAIQKYIKDNQMDLSRICLALEKIAKKIKVDVNLETRVKTVQSAFGWVNREFLERRVSDIYDVNGIRLLPNTANDCYRLLETLFSNYDIDSVRDCIAVPKATGFQGLIMRSWNYRSLEIQIQTPEMKARAENDSYRKVLTYEEFKANKGRIK